MIDSYSFWNAVIPALAAAGAFGLAGILLAKGRRCEWYRNVAWMLAATGLIQCGNLLLVLNGAQAVTVRRLALSGELWQTAALLYVGLTLMGASGNNEYDRIRWRARVVAVLALGLGSLAWWEEIYTLPQWKAGIGEIGVNNLGRVIYAFLVLALAIGIGQFETILRKLREPHRFQLKFVLVGLGGLAGYEIYQDSQVLLMSVWKAEYAIIGGWATLLSLGLVTFGLVRSRLEAIKTQVYVSPQIVYGSVTFILIGMYLVAVGVLGQLVRWSGRPWSQGLISLVAFSAVVGLVITVLSRTARNKLRGFVLRHFYRTKYDYRSKWLEVTEAFRGCSSIETILDELLAVLSRTFGAERISIWLHCEADERFHQVRSVNPETPPTPLPASHPMVVRLRGTETAANLHEDTKAPLRDPAAQGADHFLEHTQAVLIAPISFGADLGGFVALSRDPKGTRYGPEDCDLLQAVLHHVSVLISQAKLAEERRAAAQLEALHRFTAFCLHDLKNLAARLTLVVQNAKSHGGDPAFRETAMRTVADTADQMVRLIGKFSTKPLRGSTEKKRPTGVDVNRVIEETVGSINGARHGPIKIEGHAVSPVRIPRDQLQQVLLNLILNAQQAGEKEQSNGEDIPKEILICSEQRDGTVFLEVTDRGPGIDPGKLRTLFNPGRSDKTGGLGIGLYECKRIIEAHRGRFLVDSELGIGTRVRIEIPADRSASA